MSVQPATVAETIRATRPERRGALIGYVPVGFPDLDTSVAAAVTMATHGVDVIEFGVPYSDPVMDGPVIQAATQQALAAGFRLRDIFDAVRRVRQAVPAPVLVMTYLNPVLRYGMDRFAASLREAGGAGLITPDLTPDAAEQWLRASEQHQLERVFLAAPTSSDERLRMIARASTGFVYTVSTMGITGERAAVDESARALTGRLRQAGAELACVGIGISSGQQVAETLDYADGAIVGSALVRALGAGGVQQLGDTVRQLAAGTAQQ